MSFHHPRTPPSDDDVLSAKNYAQRAPNAEKYPSQIDKKTTVGALVYADSILAATSDAVAPAWFGPAMQVALQPIHARLDAINASLGGIDARLDGIGARLDGIDARLDGIDARLDGIDARLDGIGARLDGINARLDGTIARLDGIDARLDGIDTRVDGIFAKIDQLRNHFHSQTVIETTAGIPERISSRAGLNLCP
ncbi:hypothetical protein C8R44DRAFT_981926 [Mycena epipterygia]|nr:hypothetical protein C8R44DRAFT_981926 [Mycena epipterygia]